MLTSHDTPYGACKVSVVTCKRYLIQVLFGSYRIFALQ